MVNNKISFKFQYSKLVLSLLIGVILLSIGGLIFNVVNFINVRSSSLLPINRVFRIVSLILNALLIAFAISVTVYSRYIIDTENIYCKFGIITSTYRISDIVSFTLFTKSNKLVAYFSDAQFTVIVIKDAEYQKFIDEVRKNNPSIVYEQNIDDKTEN